ncbi:MAG TPA: GNAT family N-acetyltransferase [Actinomycetota bacterium]|nr:GNAT family N-acetyltransferase [Actinomycetota bacterium]
MQPGTVHVDRVDDPRVVFVATRFGFAQLLSPVEHDGQARAVLDLMFDEADLKGRYLLWYDPPEPCRRLLDRLPKKPARSRTRIRLVLDRDAFARSPRPAPAAGVELVDIDADVLARLEPLGLDIGGRFWPSENAFLERGLGVAGLTEGVAASAVYSACVVRGVAEVDVATLERFRGRGLAGLVVERFARRCLERGLVPTWDCFDYNEPSLRLARRLGFEERARYPFYSFTV